MMLQKSCHRTKVGVLRQLQRLGRTLLFAVCLLKTSGVPCPMMVLQSCLARTVERTDWVWLSVLFRCSWSQKPGTD